MDAAFVRLLGKQRQVPCGPEISARGEPEAPPPWHFTAIHLTLRVRNRHLQLEAVRKAFDLAEGKYCPVSASLRPQVKRGSDVEIVPDPA